MTTLLALLLACLPALPQPNYTPKPYEIMDLRDQLARKWLLIGVEMNGKKYGEAWLERQRQNGLASVLEFQKSGACQVHIFTKGHQGRSQKKTTLNKWQLSEDEKKITILTANAPPQVFTIVKASAKRLVLASDLPDEKQTFTYKAVKD